MKIYKFLEHSIVVNVPDSSSNVDLFVVSCICCTSPYGIKYIGCSRESLTSFLPIKENLEEAIKQAYAIHWAMDTFYTWKEAQQIIPQGVLENMEKTLKKSLFLNN